MSSPILASEGKPKASAPITRHARRCAEDGVAVRATRRELRCRATEWACALGGERDERDDRRDCQEYVVPTGIYVVPTGMRRIGPSRVARSTIGAYGTSSCNNHSFRLASYTSMKQRKSPSMQDVVLLSHYTRARLRAHVCMRKRARVLMKSQSSSSASAAMRNSNSRNESATFFARSLLR
jgi:hypothetical protein